MSFRNLTAACLSSCALAALLVPARADLAVPLPGKASRPTAPAPDSPPAPEASLPAPAAPAALPTPSRPQPRQVGVTRRGKAPVLPPVNHVAPLGSAAPARSPIPGPLGPPPLEVSGRLGKMLAPQTDVFKMPDPRSQWVGRVKQGQQVAVVSQWNGWFAIVMEDGSQAYVPATHVELLPYAVKTVIPKLPQAAPPPPPPAPGGDQAWAPFEAPRTEAARALLAAAFQYRGVPYVYGGNSRSGIDCSGFVRNCFAELGIQLPRRASEQARVGDEVPLDQLVPGDRLYFSVKRPHDHTGIYLGNGYFIHAGRSRGDVGVDHLSQRLYSRSLASARRL